ncbi:mast cell tryptase-like protein [Leptotrombidium deliense]|uniref:Mast cell tryptase-like protein n=1 Tax=Leptotrombidium deliense TaxID=299467 RepID=A0A443RU05_9ACAR|nr:mast cell tryptase-like protein [Leptotrombidium deliense]
MIPMILITATLLAISYISFLVREQCICGHETHFNRTVRGTKVANGRYPWFARLKIRIPGYENSRFCAGAVIKNLYVLTAAHCIESANIVYVGLSNDFDNHSTAAYFISHPEYNDSRNFYHDIGLVKLKTNGVFGAFKAYLFTTLND